MQTPYTIIGIDPGFERLGVAVLEKGTSGKEKLLYSDCIRTSADDAFPVRLEQLGTALISLFIEYEPEVVALERVYFNTNQKTALMVAEVRGVCMYLARTHKAEVVEYTPSAIKVAVAGSGNASKADIQTMVKRLVHFTKKGALDDEYDAIAAALTASASLRFR